MKILPSLLLSVAGLASLNAGAIEQTENTFKQHVEAELFVHQTSQKKKDSGEP